MSIQWFPGHMNSARIKAQETMEITDLVIEVVDSRCPMASSNPMVEQMRLFRQRPCLKILNKSDLSDPNITKQWLAHLNAQPNTRAITINTKQIRDIQQILPECQQLAPHRHDASKPLRMMIMGVPNVGKSTLMNALLKRRVARVGDEPAVTKTQQRLLLSDNMVLTDTPGMLWPKIELANDGVLLAAIHAIGINAYYEDDIAIYLAGWLKRHYPKLLLERYKIKSQEALDQMDDVGVIEAISAHRGFRGKGGLLDFEKAAQVLLVESRTGVLGRISLESPDSRAKLVETHRIEMIEKERAIQEKKDRKQQHLIENRRANEAPSATSATSAPDSLDGSH